MPQEEHTYEIGSLTKTFTAALIEKVIIEGKIGSKITRSVFEKGAIVTIAAANRRLSCNVVLFAPMFSVSVLSLVRNIRYNNNKFAE